MIYLQGRLDLTITGVVRAYLVVSLAGCPLKGMGGLTVQRQEEEIAHVARGVQFLHKQVVHALFIPN